MLILLWRGRKVVDDYVPSPPDDAEVGGGGASPSEPLPMQRLGRGSLMEDDLLGAGAADDRRLVEAELGLIGALDARMMGDERDLLDTVPTTTEG